MSKTLANEKGLDAVIIIECRERETINFISDLLQINSTLLGTPFSLLLGYGKALKTLFKLNA